MRILHVVPSYLPATRYGGQVSSVHGLCKALAARGHHIEVATTNVDGAGVSDVPLDRPVELDGVSVRYFASRYLRRLCYSPEMRRFITTSMPAWDLIHTHSVFLWPTTIAARLARRHRKPYVLSPLGMLVPLLIARRSRWVKRAWIAIFERANVEGAAAIHVTSRREEEELLATGLHPRRLVEIPNGIDFTPAPAMAAGKLPTNLPATYVLFVGRISWEKGLDRLIAALAQAPGIQLVIAGNDDKNYRPTLERLAGTWGVSPRIHFVGFVDGEEKRALMSNARLLVLPSYSESFGNVVLEAMALGTPVVVTREVGAADIVSAARSGLVVDGDPASLAGALAALWSNARLRSEMSSEARSAARSFEWSRIAEQFENHYQSILRAAESDSTRSPP